MPKNFLSDEHYEQVLQLANRGLCHTPDDEAMEFIEAMREFGNYRTQVEPNAKSAMAQKYPQYFKDVSQLVEMDTYVLNTLFPVTDDSGCILHARKKLLIPGVRTGDKPAHKDIKEARDTLNRWLQINGHE
jgi:hypothetical protein